MSLKLIPASLVAFSLATLSLPATADPVPVGTEAVSVKVVYSDLDLSNQAGAAELLARIERAANIACGEAPTHDITTMRGYKACVTAAVTKAVADVGAPALVAMEGTQSASLELTQQ